MSQTRIDAATSAAVNTSEPARPLRVAQWATAVTAIAIIVFIVAYAMLIAAMTGPAGLVEDSMIRKAISGLFYSGYGVAMVGFGLGVRARIKHETWKGLRLALLFFPILTAILIATDGFVFPG